MSQKWGMTSGWFVGEGNIACGHCEEKNPQQMECVVSNPDSVALILPAVQECPRRSRLTKWPFGFEPDWAGDNKVDKNGVVSHARAGWGHVLCDYELKTFGPGLVICGDFVVMLPASLNRSACKNYVTRWCFVVGKNHKSQNVPVWHWIAWLTWGGHLEWGSTEDETSTQLSGGAAICQLI